MLSLLLCLADTSGSDADRALRASGYAQTRIENAWYVAAGHATPGVLRDVAVGARFISHHRPVARLRQAQQTGPGRGGGAVRFRKGISRGSARRIRNSRLWSRVLANGYRLSGRADAYGWVDRRRKTRLEASFMRSLDKRALVSGHVCLPVGTRLSTYGTSRSLLDTCLLACLSTHA